MLILQSSFLVNDDICIYIYIYLGKFDHDLTVLPHWNHG